jgi:hypothetical protein
MNVARRALESTLETARTLEIHPLAGLDVMKREAVFLGKVT